METISISRPDMSTRQTRSMTSLGSSALPVEEVKTEEEEEEEMFSHQRPGFDREELRTHHSPSRSTMVSSDLELSPKQRQAQSQSDTRVNRSNKAVVPGGTVGLSEVVASSSKESEEREDNNIVIKQEMVSSEYSLEWWYDISPTPLTSSGNEAVDYSVSESKVSDYSSEPKWPSTNGEESKGQNETNADLKRDESKPEKCKDEYEMKDPALEDTDAMSKPDVNNLTQCDPEQKELPVPKVDEKRLLLPPATFYHSSQCANSEIPIRNQEDFAINLTIPKSKRNNTGETHLDSKDENRNLTNVDASTLGEKSPTDYTSRFRGDNSIRSQFLLSAPGQPSSAPSSFSHSSEYCPPPNSEHCLPWSLGLCRAPLYTHPPLPDPKAVTAYGTSGFQLHHPHGLQAPQGISETISSAVTTNAGVDVISTARSFGSVSTPYAVLPIKDMRGVRNFTNPFIPTSVHSTTPFYGHMPSQSSGYEVERHPGIVLLASQSMYFQNVPYLAVMSSPGHEQANRIQSRLESSHAIEGSSAKPIATSVTKDVPTYSYNNESNSIPDAIGTSVNERRGYVESTTITKSPVKSKRFQDDRHDIRANNRVKKSKASRKATFMEALGFVDPTRIKLSQDDEEYNDNEFMKEDFEGNNSSDEDWMPEVTEGKTRDDCLRVHEDSSTDDGESDKRRKTREGRKHRSNACRRGRPIAKAIACPTCGKVFHGKYHLKRHEMSHTETRPFECMTCGKKFKQKAHLQGHEMIHQRQKTQPKPKKTVSHTGNQIESLGSKCSGRPKKNYSEKELSCTTCQKSFKTVYRLKRHVQSHTDERPYSCRICGKGFKQTGHRNEHEANHEKNRRKFLCNMCGVIFRCRSSFNNHLKGHRGEKQLSSLRPIALHHTDLTDEQDADGQFDDTVNRTGYDCPYCSDKFSTAQGLNRHLDSHIEVHQRLHVQPYTCKHCSRSFTYKHNLLKHMLAHLAPEKYALYHKTKLEQHVASGKPCYKCSTCSKMFIRKETLVKHSKIHTGYKPFKCLICGKEFSQNVHLKVHMRKHTGNRPFQCKRCNRGFIDSTALAKHIEYEACIIENVFYNCKLCDKRHYYLGSIKQHIQRHHRKEDVEQFIHRIQRQRQRARKTRNDKSQHTCQVCSSTFTEKGNLVRHVKRKHKELLKLLNENSADNPSANAPRAPNNGSYDSTASISKKSESKIVKSAESPHGNGNISASSETNDSNVASVNLSGDLQESCEANNNPRHPLTTDVALLRQDTEAGSPDSLVPDDVTTDRACNDDVYSTEDLTCAIDLSHSSTSSYRHSHKAGNAETDGGSADRMESEATIIIRNEGVVSDTPGDLVRKGTRSDYHQRDNTASQNHNAVSFLYQFGLMVSDRAKNKSEVDEEGLTTAWSTQYSGKAEAIVDTATAQPAETESETTPKMTVESNESSDEGSFAIDLSCRSQSQHQQPQSDLELFCNLALMSEKTDRSPSYPVAKHSQLRMPDMRGHLENRYASNANKCDDKSSDNTSGRREGNVVEPTSSDADVLDHVDGRSKEIEQKTKASLRETFAAVKPWLQQLLGQSPRSEKDQRLRSPLSRRLSVRGVKTEKRHDSSTFDKRQPIERGNIHQETLGPHADNNTAANAAEAESNIGDGNVARVDSAISEKVSERGGRGDFCLATEEEGNLSFREKYQGSVFPISHESEDDDDDGGNGSGDATGCHLNDAVHKSDSAASVEQSPLVVCVSGGNSPQLMPRFEAAQIQPVDPNSLHFGDQSMTAVHAERSSSLNRPTAGPSGDVALTLTSSTLGSSREAMTQTQSPPEIVPPHYFGSSPLTMAFLLRAPEDLSPATASARVTVSGAASFNRVAVPSKPKESLSFPCETCGKCFNARHQLKRHEMTHTEIRPYGCPECGRAFRQKVHLSDHLKRHGGQRPFACPACGKRFVLKNELKQHAKNYCRKMIGGDLDVTLKPQQLVAMPLEGLSDLGSDGGPS